MTSFQSQQPAASSSHTFISVLTGAGAYSLFSKDVKQHCISNFGKSGQELISGVIIAPVHRHPGRPPHYGDSRIHPTNGTPIPGTRKYLQVELTEDEEKIQDFDTDTLELTAEGKADLKHDNSNYYRELQKHTEEIDKRQVQDTLLLNFILAHCSPTVKDTIKTNSKMADFEVNSAKESNYHRGYEYFNILTDQYSKGNSTTTVTEVTKFFDLSQSSDITPLFINRVADQLQKIRPLIESSTHPGFVDIKRLHSMVIIKGLDKTQPANLRALEIHLQTHPGPASLDNPSQLIEFILQYQQSDLATLSLDNEQTSAYASFTPPPHSNVKKSLPQSTSTTPTRAPGTKIPGNDKHCPFCLALSKGTKYFYHKEADCRQKKASTATSTTRANVATPAFLTTQMAFDHLASEGYTFADAPADLPDK